MRRLVQTEGAPDTVDLPTPPLPEATATTCRTPRGRAAARVALPKRMSTDVLRQFAQRR